MNDAARMTQIDAALAGMHVAWPAVCHEIKLLIADYTAALVSQNNEETRGRIKALHDLMDLPEALEAERRSILAAELPEPDSAL
jgi:hypothetical protein